MERLNRPLFTIAFNSLFGIQQKLENRTKDERETFNSLFGIQPVVLDFYSLRAVTFNSLFGILREELGLSYEEDLPFNSLFGILVHKKSPPRMLMHPFQLPFRDSPKGIRYCAIGVDSFQLPFRDSSTFVPGVNLPSATFNSLFGIR